VAWTDNLRPCSFRNVPCFWNEAEKVIGRRIVLHEYPKRDVPYPEDMGRAARQWSLNLYVLGPDDYQSKRDALEAAIEKPGPGILVHPTYGEISVVVLPPCRVSESTRRGGMARFSVTFVEAGSLSFQAQPSTGANVVTAASAAQATAQQGFASRFSIADMPSFVSGSALSDLGDALTQVSTVMNTIAAPFNAVYRWALTANALLTAGISLIPNPLSYANSIFGLIQNMSTMLSPVDASGTPAIGGWQDQLNRPASGMTSDQVAQIRSAQIALASLSPSSPAVTATTPARAAEAANQAALFALIRQGALLEASQAAAASSFASRNDAIAARDQIAALMENEALDAADAGDDATAQALDDARIAMVQDVTTRAADLPVLITVVTPRTMPAIVLAHRIYDDPSYDADLIARNKVRHPLFVAGGNPLEVLLDG
jgi:prophage DNA circulation protein